MQVPEKTSHAYLLGEELVLEDFREHDPDVIDFVREADDLEGAVHRCLTMGARALRLAGATLDSELVEHRFAELTTELDRTIVDFATRVDESAEGLLGEEDGRLTIALRAWLEDTGKLLGDTFDEDSKKSAIAKLEKVLDKARDDQVRAVRQLLDSDNEESPLGRWRSEIVKTVKEQGGEIGKALDGLREQLGIAEASAAVLDKSTQKGRPFEEAVFAQVQCFAAGHEDVAEHLGDIPGHSGKVGDVVVTLSGSDTPGRVVRYVVEAKNKPMTLKKALDELDAAMANRDADSAVMVFAGQNICPLDEPFQWFDHKAIVVLDEDDPDPSALRLACAWARWTARRNVSEDVGSVDLDRVRALLDSARLSLKTVTTIKGDHTRATAAIGQASAHLAALTNELKSALEQLEGELTRAED